MGVGSTLGGGGIVHFAPASDLTSVPACLTLNSAVITTPKSVNCTFYCEAKEIYEAVAPGDRGGDTKLS